MTPSLSQQFLEAITDYFVESGPVLEKTSDDLRFELDFQNDWSFEHYPGASEDVTLLQLLRASTAHVAADGQDPVRLHIHHLIEVAFLEQEMLRAIETLWPETHSNDLTLAHVALMEAAVSDYLGREGTELFQALAERVRQKEPQESSAPAH